MFKKVGIIGGGQMGAGIAQVVAAKAVNVVLVDISAEFLSKALESINNSCARLIKKEKMSEQDKKNLLNCVNTSQNLNALKDCEFVIEAVPESFELKKKIFNSLSDTLSTKAIICSNTSSISMTRLAATVSCSERFAGMHFMNPVPLMPLVEGIQALQTDDEIFEQIRGFAKFLDKIFVASKDQPGFIVNRILMPMLNEAVYILQEGVSTVEDIDAAMKLGTNQPMGPLTLADFIGLDTCLAIMGVLHEGLGDSKYRAAPLLKNYVEAGYLGRKSGRGFYNYNKS